MKKWIKTGFKGKGGKLKKETTERQTICSYTRYKLPEGFCLGKANLPANWSVCEEFDRKVLPEIEPPMHLQSLHFFVWMFTLNFASCDM
jgi:hypothetical protein